MGDYYDDLDELLKFENNLENEVQDSDSGSLFDIMLANNYHILVAGSTGSGKSVLINGFLSEYLKREEHGHIYIIDPKRVGFMPFKKCKAVKILANKDNQFIPTLECTAKNMDMRYRFMEKHNVDTFEGDEILLVIDEFADLVTGDKEVQDLVITILRLGRQARVRVLLATQAPQRKVINASIQQNCGLRIGLRTTSSIESRQIIGDKGCEELPRYGECLVLEPGKPITRYQVPYTDIEDIKETINLTGKRLFKL